MLKDAQDEIHSWVSDYKVPYWSPLSQFARLAEEVGELGRLLNHLYGDKPKKETEARQELGKEIMDVMFTAMCLANSHGINLDDEFKATMEKCRTRDKDRFEKKEAESPST